MSHRTMPFSQAIEQARRRWMPGRRALSKEDQEACDRMCACATHQLPAEVRLGRPWAFEAALMAVLLAQKKRVVELVRRIEEFPARLDAREQRASHP
jgi:hypothetical protein